MFGQIIRGEIGYEANYLSLITILNDEKLKMNGTFSTPVLHRELLFPTPGTKGLIICT